MKLSLSAFAAAAAVTLASAAHAQTANISYSHLNVGQGLTWTMDGETRSTWGGSFFVHVNAADAPMDQFVGSDLLVYCLDPLQWASYSALDYSQVSLSGLQLFGVNGTAKENAIRRLLGFTADLHNSTADANYATAFQVSLWEIARDYDGTAGSLDAFGGGFFYNESSLGGNAAAVKSNVLSMLAAAGNPGSPLTTDDVFAMRNDWHQDYIHTQPGADRLGVPEPGEWAAMGVLGAGLGGLIVRKRRVRA